MSVGVDFYFDYLSPYAYFASLALPDLCRVRDVELRWRPVLFAGLLNHWGQLGPAEVPPKAVNNFKQSIRYAARRGIPFRSTRFHPFVPLTALRVSLSEVSGDDAPRVAETLFGMGWAHGADLGDPDVIASGLTDAGFDGTRLVERSREPSVKAQLRSDTEAAVARGVFGIPTMIVGDELFWGVDQIRDLAGYLDGDDPLSAVRLDDVRSEGRAAVRPGSLDRR